MSDNPKEEMPQEVWSTGVSAIDKFADAVLSFFPNNGKCVTLVNSPVVNSLMSKLGLEHLSSEISCWNDFSDIFQFAMTVANEMKKNVSNNSLNFSSCLCHKQRFLIKKKTLIIPMQMLV